MDQPVSSDFKNATPVAGLTMKAAIAVARHAVEEMTSMPIDAVAHCSRLDAGGWLIVVDVIEAAARMGDNDLLASYEVQLSEAGDLTRLNRQRRYHREDKDQQ